MTTAYLGHSATLSIGTNAVGQITNISGPNLTRDSIDVSNMGSTEGWKEHIPGMLDAGECTVDVIYDGGSAATHVSTILHAQLVSTAAPGTITVTFPDSGTWAASGFVTSLGHTMPAGDKVTQSVGLKFTGKPTVSY